MLYFGFVGLVFAKEKYRGRALKEIGEGHPGKKRAQQKAVGGEMGALRGEGRWGAAGNTRERWHTLP